MDTLEHMCTLELVNIIFTISRTDGCGSCEKIQAFMERIPYTKLGEVFYLFEKRCQREAYYVNLGC